LSPDFEKITYCTMSTAAAVRRVQQHEYYWKIVNKWLKDVVEEVCPGLAPNVQYKLFECIERMFKQYLAHHPQPNNTAVQAIAVVAFDLAYAAFGLDEDCKRRFSFDDYVLLCKRACPKFLMHQIQSNMLKIADWCLPESRYLTARAKEEEQTAELADFLHDFHRPLPGVSLAEDEDKDKEMQIPTTSASNSGRRRRSRRRRRRTSPKKTKRKLHVAKSRKHKRSRRSPFPCR
jgi:hypothetical protein